MDKTAETQVEWLWIIEGGSGIIRTANRKEVVKESILSVNIAEIYTRYELLFDKNNNVAYKALREFSTH